MGMLISLLLLTVSILIFIGFGYFTLKLMRQHRDIYSLLYALEEEEKKRG
ncbi:MAG: hypothetical protein QW304_09075 [Thermoproteota archaeon]|nr:hypothetical protein [Candidatus Bathyarchaeota archaeon]